MSSDRRHRPSLAPGTAIVDLFVATFDIASDRMLGSSQPAVRLALRSILSTIIRLILDFYLCFSLRSSSVLSLHSTLDGYDLLPPSGFSSVSCVHLQRFRFHLTTFLDLYVRFFSILYKNATGLSPHDRPNIVIPSSSSSSSSSSPFFLRRWMHVRFHSHHAALACLLFTMVAMIGLQEFVFRSYSIRGRLPLALLAFAA